MVRSVTRVALYARYSSDNQRSESIDAQLRAMHSYCQQHHYQVVKTYVDEARSATTDRRPSFLQMIEDSSSKLFDVVLVHKLDRFARNRYDSAMYKRELKKNGVALYSVLENLDDSPESIMMEAVLEGMAEYYSQNLARETMKGMRETALQCKHTGGKPPLGFDVDPITKKLIVNEQEAETVREIFGMYAEGYGYGAILDQLHAEQRYTKRGQDFAKNSLYGILTNEKYRGLYVFNKVAGKSAAGTRNSHKFKDSSEVIMVEGGCPAIISKDVFERVQERIKENIHTGSRGMAKTTYLLSGKVKCKDCGRMMVGNSHRCGRDKTFLRTYRCPTPRHSCGNREINCRYLEKAIIALIEDEILNPVSFNEIAAAVQEYNETHASKRAVEQQGIVTELQSVTESIANVTAAIENGLISAALVKRLQELEDKKLQLERQLQEAGNAGKEIEHFDPDELLKQYTLMREKRFSQIKRDQLEYKTFIDQFIDKVEVGRYTVEVTLKIFNVIPEFYRAYSLRREQIYEK